MTAPGTAYEPGQFVRNPARPDWGLGQVQSVVGARVTVNFDHAGKLLINTASVFLAVADLHEERARPPPPDFGAP